MPYTRCPMRHVRDVLRLKFECKLRNRPIARSLGISRNTFRLILQRSQKVRVVWLLPPDLTDSALENLLGSLHLHLRRGVPVPDPPRMDRRPRDKAKVENGFLLAKHWVLAVLRHRVFHSLAEMNAAIRELLEKLNDRPSAPFQDYVKQFSPPMMDLASDLTRRWGQRTREGRIDE